jgi:hypothetical protein
LEKYAQLYHRGPKKPVVLFMKILLVFFFLVTIVACNEKKDDDNPPALIIKGFLLTDALGHSICVWDDLGFDWQPRDWSALSALEQSFLNFSESVDLNNTVVTTVNNPTAYPNPFVNAQYLNMHAADSVKIKIAVVDSTGHVYQTHSQKIKGNKTIAFDFSNAAVFRDGMSLRYYFSYSAAAQANFKAGYGDVKICRGCTMGSGCISQCFN